MRKPLARQGASCFAALFALLAATLAQPLHAADIYRAQLPNGEERFATQKLDASYELFLRDDSLPASAPGFKRRHDPATAARANAIRPLVLSLTQKHGVDFRLVWAVIEVESRFNPQALSRKGAYGLMQLMPATAARYGVTDRHDVAQNLEAGIRCLKDLLARHEGSLTLALAAYNAGAGAVSRHGKRIPPWRETMLYVPAVLVQMQAED